MFEPVVDEVHFRVQEPKHSSMVLRLGLSAKVIPYAYMHYLIYANNTLQSHLHHHLRTCLQSHCHVIISSIRIIIVIIYICIGDHWMVLFVVALTACVQLIRNNYLLPSQLGTWNSCMHNVKDQRILSWADFILHPITEPVNCIFNLYQLPSMSSSGDIWLLF